MVGHTNFHLELPSHWKIHDIFHAKLLHSYKETEEHGENFTEPPPDLIDGEPEWKVEQILNMRTQQSEKQYLIRWKGYSSAHDSWEPWENINAPLLMVEFEKRRSAQNKEGTQEGQGVQKKDSKMKERTIRSRAIYLEKDTMCNRTPPTPAHSISSDRDLIPSPLSLLSSNLWVVYYGDAAAMYGQAQQRMVRQEEEEEVAPEDSASTRVSPTQGLTNALNVLALVHDGTFTEEDVVMDHAQPDGFEEALQSFRAIQDELDDVLADDNNGELNVSHQLGRRGAGPPKTMAERTLEEVFMEQGIAGPSTTTEYEARAGPLPLEDDESAVMSSLDSQLSDAATHPNYPFWRYKRALHSAPILLPDPITDRGILQRADYVAFNVEKHDGEPTVYSTMGGNAPASCNVLHTEPRPEIVAGTEGDDIYLLGERFQMDRAVTRAIEAIGDTGVMADILRLRKFSEHKREIQRECQWLGRLADFLTAKWHRHYTEEKQMRDQEKATIE